MKKQDSDMRDKAAQALAAEMRAATLAHGRKIGVMDEFGQLTEEALKVIEVHQIKSDDFKCPGNSYLDSKAKNLFICDLELKWQLVMNTRKSEDKHSVSAMGMTTQENG